MQSLAELVPVRGLADCCVDVLSYAFHLTRASEDPGDAQSMATRLTGMFQKLQQQAVAAGYAQEEIQLAHYALAALLDEIILTSNWSLKSQWLGRPLQMQLFNSFNAGEEFYVKLEALRQNEAQLNALEVYYLCLCLGFKGKHGGVEGFEVLKGLRAELGAHLVDKRQGGSRGRHPTQSGAGRSSGKGDGLSPRWKPSDQRAAGSKELPIRAVGVACLVALLLLYVLLVSVLSAGTSSVLEKLG